MNTLLLDALSRKNHNRPPIWLMRQAGRYMPEYQVLRKKISLFDMFHHVDLIVQISLLPIRLLEVDAAILFADILSVLDGLGIGWHFEEGKGPIIPEPVTPKTIFQKNTAYTHTKKAIAALKKELKVPLIGFAGAPFTVASYLIEGGSSKELKKTKKWAYVDPASFDALLGKITEATIDYLNVQIEAGVDCVQLFDSWASHLSLASYKELCLPHLKKIVSEIKVPVILFSKGGFPFAKEFGFATCISCDWIDDIAEIRKKMPENALQGNLDPALLLTDPKTIHLHTSRILTSMKGDQGFIFNLGHGIFPETPFSHVKSLVDYVKSHSI